MGCDWTSNKDDVINQIKDGGWAVAFGREITYEDVATLVGVIVISDGNPAVVLAWLSDLLYESLRQMETSIANTFTPQAQEAAHQFAQGVIGNLIHGKTFGEDSLNIGQFNLKAGVAQFVGHNAMWVPNLSPEGGFCQQTTPDVFSYCPYIGLRFDPSLIQSLQRVQWIGEDERWYNENSPGVWHAFNGLQAPLFVGGYLETGRDNNFVYLKNDPNGASIELALGANMLYARLPGQSEWGQLNRGYWRV